jgi:cytochrome o ubiquinol oxidase subunit 3
MTDAAITTENPTGPSVSPARGHGAGGPAPANIVVSFGFWVFLLSDIVMFAALFAAYAVLHGNTAGGPSPRDLFHLPKVGLETALLLTSSFTCGMLFVASSARTKPATYAAAAATFLLGAAFVTMEFSDFASLAARGFGPSRSAFLSAYFTLVGAHGAHVTLGLVWLLVMMAQVATRGFRATTLRRLFCFSLFWHALDIVWVAVFTVVYLMGVR